MCLFVYIWRGEVNIRCLFLFFVLYFEDRFFIVFEILLFWLEKLVRSFKDVFCYILVFRIEVCVFVGFFMDVGVLNLGYDV